MQRWPRKFRKPVREGSRMNLDLPNIKICQKASKIKVWNWSMNKIHQWKRNSTKDLHAHGNLVNEKGNITIQRE